MMNIRKTQNHTNVDGLRPHITVSIIRIILKYILNGSNLRQHVRNAENAMPVWKLTSNTALLGRKLYPYIFAKTVDVDIEQSNI